MTPQSYIEEENNCGNDKHESSITSERIFLYYELHLRRRKMIVYLDISTATITTKFLQKTRIIKNFLGRNSLMSRSILEPDPHSTNL